MIPNSGKKSLQFNGTSFILIAYIKYLTCTVKISLFSKRTNDFIFTKYFYKEVKTISDLIDYARLKFEECIIRNENTFGGSFEL